MASSLADKETSAPRGWAALAARPERVTLGLFGLAFLFALIPLFRVIRHSSSLEWGPVFIWGILLTLTALVLGAINVTVPASGGLEPAERVRLMVLLLGGCVGLLTSLLGLALPLTEYADVFRGGMKEWRKNPWPLTWTTLALFGGLALMFVSLLLARGAEKASTSMRRVLLGYNAVLSSLLLAVILGLVNLLPYTNIAPFAFLSRVFDSTSSGIYTLSQSTKNLLTDLQQPVNVYVLLTNNHRAAPQVDTLLENFRNVTSKISWSTLSRDLNQRRLEELIQKYSVPNSFGLLVLYGPEGSEKSDFIPVNDFFSALPAEKPGDPDRFVFKGEAALIKSLNFLAEGKTKPVVYFTQGQGELVLNDRGFERPDQGLGVLRELLTRGNYEPKPLQFGPDVKKVPDDADTVVIARPRAEFAPDVLAALRDYLQGVGRKQKGKLLVLFDVAVRPDGGMVHTGLESMLREYSVEVNDDRVLDAGRRDPTILQVVPNDESTNPVARAFVLGRGVVSAFYFEDARSVTPLPANPRGGAYTAETLLFTGPDTHPWIEKDLSANPSVLGVELRKPGNDELRKKKLSPKPISVAVTVSEGASPRPPIPGHPPVGGDSKPRLVVFGDASWVTNQALAGQLGQTQGDLFKSCLAWLRERPDVGTSAADQGLERPRFALGIDSESDAATRLKWLPGSLMLLGIVGIAGGVWVTRRR
jgi:hypothetical protein